MEIKPGQIYKHTQTQTEYRIVSIAKFQAPDEYPDLDMIDVVVYDSLYDNPISKFWVRPLKDFTEEIEIDGKKVTRFQFIIEK